MLWDVIDFLPWSVLRRFIGAIRPIVALRNEAYRKAKDARRRVGETYAVHIRHGNGELYGIGSPEEAELFRRYKQVLIKLKEEGKSFFLVTDSIVVHEWFRSAV